MYVEFRACFTAVEFLLSLNPVHHPQGPYAALRPAPFHMGAWSSPGSTEMLSPCSQLSDGTTPAEDLHPICDVR